MIQKQTIVLAMASTVKPAIEKLNYKKLQILIIPFYKKHQPEISILISNKYKNSYPEIFKQLYIFLCQTEGVYKEKLYALQ